MLGYLKGRIACAAIKVGKFMGIEKGRDLCRTLVMI